MNCSLTANRPNTPFGIIGTGSGYSLNRSLATLLPPPRPGNVWPPMPPSSRMRSKQSMSQSLAPISRPSAPAFAGREVLCTFLACAFVG